ncbi:MAG TPA: hypothetical protein PK103_05115 [Elusimicrobiales bacterium]|nr:hypothetical protein [Elusimicrobiales bacterium]HOL62731.1 hypothetical protein [Elusimicrobiales bacterium]HPO96070.1 hypothetical protein [Elusimicrobiales bacterium]
MKDRRKKVFLMSVLVFLVCSSTVYIFLIINAINDFKSKPYFYSQYSGAKRAVIPILKYLGVVDTEVVSDPKKASELDIAKVDEIFNSYDSYKGAEDNGSGLNRDYKDSNYYGYSKPFKSSAKLSSDINSSSFSGGGGSNTSASVSGSFSSGSGKNINISKNLDSKNNPNYKAENLMARLNTTKTLMGSAVNAKSADSGRMDWEKGFSGSVKPGGSMFYKNNAIELDKMKAGVMDLKVADEKGLKAPEVGAPQPDRNNVSQDKAKELMQSLTKDMAQSMINAMGNGLSAGMSSSMGEGGESESEPTARSGNNSLIQQEVDKWKFDSSEKVETAYFPCGMIDCDSMGISGGGVYKAYFPDGFVLSLNPNGQPLNYYYCVSPNNEAAFLQNYKTFVVGQ